MGRIEDEKLQTEEMNDTLVKELEKRDKAVEEAVAMIVVLEAQVEKLVREREIVRAVDAEGYFDSPRQDLLNGHDKTVNRMPSFLSEQSQHTENLRNVYLTVRDSVASLPRLGEGDGDQSNANGLTSPSLSVLSESSFLSVYGQSKNRERDSPQTDEQSLLDGSAPDRPLRNDTIVTPSRLPRTNSLGSPGGRSSSYSCSGDSGLQTINDIIDQGSPLQQIERLERTMSVRDRPADTMRDRPAETRDRTAETRDRPTRSPEKTRAKPKTRDEKREGLRKVLTDTSSRVHHDRGLPPTPDTISTSTLRHYKNSNDTLSHGATETSHRSAPWEQSASHAPPRTADRQRNMSNYFDRRLAIPQRPRSADETTVSNRRASGWDSADDDDSDAHSLESSLDIWLREGWKSKERNDDGRISPDLFSFPASSAQGGWETPGFFGGNSGAQFDMSDDLFHVQQALFATTGPPPPNRRSSLHARTGSKSNTPRPHPDNRVRKSPVRVQARDTEDAPPTQHSPEQKRHHPPVSGRRALNSLFRRSIGSATPTTAPENPPVAEPAVSQKAIGVPSWVRRGSSAEEDVRASATPPPIMRNRAETGSGEGRAPAVEAEEGSGVRRKWIPGFARANSLKNRA